MNEQERRTEVERVLNEIVDPCSAACGVPIGLVDMGIVESVDVRDDGISVGLLPTFPGCLFTAVFADEIGRRLGELEWSGQVKIEVAAGSTLWDEERMLPAARERLRQSREERRRQLLALRA